MIISDLSYLESAEDTTIQGSGNYAGVSQSGYAAAGNNSSFYGGNLSYGNVAASVNVSNVDQYYSKKYFSFH